MKKYITPEIEITLINTAEDILGVSSDPAEEDKDWLSILA